MLSVAIMAHPKREAFVDKLKPLLPQATVVWDRENDRWDTGRRSMMAYDEAADWHLVVQDDAILCDRFLPTVTRALASVPLEHPVSFYTGRVRPYARFVKDAVASAQAAGLTWFQMRGPLWGVAVAVPVHLIQRMVQESDGIPIPNYDMRMAQWFQDQGIQCWYSVPSLVNHRVGMANPSLVEGRGAGLGRVAHTWEQHPGSMAWSQQALVPGDPTEWWTEDHICTRCWHQQDDLADAVRHAYERHGLGPVDFLVSTPYHAAELTALYEQLPVPAQGAFYVVGAEVASRVDKPYIIKLQRRSARQRIGKDGPFTIVGAARDFKYIGNRPGWSIVGAEAN